MMTEQTILAPSGQTRTERAAALLYAWPAISEAERSELLQFLKREPITEIGLLAGRAELKGRIEAFRAEHSHEFEIGWRTYLAVVAGFTLLLAGVVWLLWDSGLN